MRAVLQRVSRAGVSVDGQVVGAMERPGVLALVGVARGDGPEQAATIARKIAELRILDGPDGSEVGVQESGAAVLVVSQFTLYGDTRKGRRPSWAQAAPAAEAEPLVDEVVAHLRARGIEVATGRFGAMMRVELVNDGPFTVLVEA
ncbi:D-tyrosyl-tRNA(Tyr) deacylase [Schaalia sp. 19OD2882]|uniref:D-aminoacyl-tRNA deacylase n=1 Tax=Schaalia sp. 19OD2882 TaxID=2794089 RepID=UPI001C1EA83A|nr:D-aminoacyl-tRNA deacylase [Schaalia sp. 19OD2882]QWW19809.1 D-tyrosyl-tRNA(Tyr) deacylase [Schaalia sp. 19OD2882]